MYMSVCIFQSFVFNGNITSESKSKWPVPGMAAIFLSWHSGCSNMSQCQVSPPSASLSLSVCLSLMLVLILTTFSLSLSPLLPAVKFLFVNSWIFPLLPHSVVTERHFANAAYSSAWKCSAVNECVVLYYRPIHSGLDMQYTLCCQKYMDNVHIHVSVCFFTFFSSHLIICQWRE